MLFAKGKQDILNLNIPLLDITAETKLQMEINDLIDELEAIIGIVRTQIQILDNFIGLAERRLAVVRPCGPSMLPGTLRRTRFELSANEMRLKFKDRCESLVGLRNTAQNVALGVCFLLRVSSPFYVGDTPTLSPFLGYLPSPALLLRNVFQLTKIGLFDVDEGYLGA